VALVDLEVEVELLRVASRDLNAQQDGCQQRWLAANDLADRGHTVAMNTTSGRTLLDRRGCREDLGEIGAELAGRHQTAGRAFDLLCALDRYLAHTARPLVHGLRRDIERARERGLATCYLYRTLDGVHRASKAYALVTGQACG
jgi:hypothetical protein